MPTLGSTFTLFSAIPTELRLEIWRHCLPRRVCELDTPCPFIVFDDSDSSPYPCNLEGTSSANTMPPVISRVCQESRKVALKAGEMVLDFKAERPPKAGFTSGIDIDRGWQDTEHDVVHMHWSSMYRADISWGDGNPLVRLAWEAARFRQGGSLMLHCLDEEWYWYVIDDQKEFDLIDEGRKSRKEIRMNQKLNVFRTVCKWQVIINIVVVHSEFEAAAQTGLFGLLGDAPIQIVDLADTDRVEAFMSMVKADEMHERVVVYQDLQCQSAEEAQRQIRASIISKFQSEDLVASMRPAIMFRLCTEVCNRAIHTALQASDEWHGPHREGYDGMCQVRKSIMASRR